MTTVQSPPAERTTSGISRRLQLIAGGLFLAMAIIPPLLTSPLELNRFSRILVLVLAVLGVNLLTGYTGLISLGHGVFVGVGAFAVATFIQAGLPIVLAVVASTLFTGAMGLLLGLPALRVRGIHLALITFGLALAFGPVARKLPKYTGGTTGRTVDNAGFAPPDFLGVEDQTHIFRYWVTIAVVLVWFWIAHQLINSRMGRAMRTVRDNELAAATFGINIRRTKSGVLAISSAMAGCAGAMQALINPFISEGDFNAFFSLRLYAAAVVGGLGSLLGAVLGVLALIVVPAVNGAIGLISNDAVVFGAGLIIVSLIAPTGLAGIAHRLFGRSLDDPHGDDN